MPLCLFGYIGEILTEYHTAHCLPLPPMPPFVLHLGPENRNVSTAFEDFFKLPAESAADSLRKFQH